MEPKTLKNIYFNLKERSGSHSPSIETLISEIGYNIIDIDACFLSNPYATNLFHVELNKLYKNKKKWNRIIEFYPPQNQVIAKHISKVSGVDLENIVVGNGAIEIIQMLLHNYIDTNICIPTPTFSPYYEYIKDDIKIFYFKLKKENNFELDLDELNSFIQKNNIKNIVLINPNNPTGTYINKLDLLSFCNKNKHLSNIIIDESFIEFSYEDNLKEITLSKFNNVHNNLTIVKSMSKDFGIAGLRCGYGITNKTKVKELLKNGYLWNISGLSNFFFETFSNDNFQKKYLEVKTKYVNETISFFEKLEAITCNSNRLKVYKSKGNFVLIEILKDYNSGEFMIELLSKYGIYTRDCSDKIGLDGEFIRLSARNEAENIKMIKAISSYA